MDAELVRTKRSAGKARSGGREQIEPEVVPAEPAEPGRPEAEQRSTAEAEAGAGRHGCCEANVPILSLRRVGVSERSMGLAAAKAGAATVISSPCERSGGQSAGAEPARSSRKAGPAGGGRRDSDGSVGRAERRQVARKEAEKSAEINLPGSGRRKTSRSWRSAG